MVREIFDRLVWMAVIGVVLGMAGGNRAAFAEGFSLLGDRSDVIVPLDGPRTNQKSLSSWKPSKEDRSRGFAVYAVDTLVDVNPDWIWPEPNPVGGVDVFLSPERYKASALAVRTLRPVGKLTPEAGDLRSAGGGVIEAKNIDVRLVQYVSDEKNGRNFLKGKWLEKPFPVDLPENWTAWMWITFYVPKSAQPGLYQGDVTIRDGEGNSAVVPVRLNVLDFTPPQPKGSWGMFITGHFDGPDRGVYENYGYSEHWKPENLELYFKFWKNLGFNSPVLYHVYPELKCIDGHAVADFSEVREVARAMKAVGLDGELGIDLRWVEFWACTVSKKILKLKAEGKVVAGDLGIYGPDGAEDCKSGFNEESLRLFREVVEQLTAIAKKENWPPYRLMVEEELWTPCLKTETYDFFMPALLQVAPEHAFLVDNAIGYSDEAVDRGARDKLRVREYNNWTEKGLADARRDGAEIRSYNLGFFRATVALYQQRIGSTGYHLWADQWGQRAGRKGDPIYSYTLITPQGMISSVEVERSREGLDDFAFFKYLEALADQLDAKGMKSEADAARKLPAEIAGACPINRYAYFDWQAGVPGRQLDRYRWQVALAIQNARKLLGQSVRTFDAAAPGTPGFLGLEQQVRHEETTLGKNDKTDKLIRAIRLDTPIILDGKADEKCWHCGRNSTGPLGWMGFTESAMRARAGTLEDFQKMPPPSSAHAQIAYDEKGLYLLVQCNHSTAETSIGKHGDDDPDLWEDDCMEFFFEPKPGGSHYQLIVNVKGKRVLRRPGTDVIRDSEMKTATVSPAGKGGGYDQEIFVPWKALGLSGPPVTGTAWRMNVAREFHSWNQLMSWGRVYSQFDEKDKWGTLVFAGREGKVNLEQVDFGSRYPGLNQMTGRLVVEASVKDQFLTAVLVDGEGRKLARKKVQLAGADGAVPFEMRYNVPVMARPATWQVKFLDAKGEELGRIDLPLLAADATVAVDRCPAQVVSGEVTAMDISIRLGNLSVHNRNLEGVLISETGKRIQLNPIPVKTVGSHQLWLATDGLEPGSWKLALRISGMGDAESSGEVTFDVLPSFVTLK